MKCLHQNLHWPGNYHEIASLAAIQQPALIVFVGHRQTLEERSSCSSQPEEISPAATWPKSAQSSGRLPTTCSSLRPYRSAMAWCVPRWKLWLWHCAGKASRSRASHWYMGCNRAGAALAVCLRTTSGHTNPPSPQCNQQPCCHGALGYVDCHGTRGIWCPRMHWHSWSSWLRRPP